VHPQQRGVHGSELTTGGILLSDSLSDGSVLSFVQYCVLGLSLGQKKEVPPRGSAGAQLIWQHGIANPVMAHGSPVWVVGVAECMLCMGATASAGTNTTGGPYDARLAATRCLCHMALSRGSVSGSVPVTVPVDMLEIL